MEAFTPSDLKTILHFERANIYYVDVDVDVDVDVAWFSPHSEYRPTEYLQAWVKFWFDDLRLFAATILQQARVKRLRE